MSCERFRRAIAEHACGAPLEPVAATHLAACAACRLRLDEECRLVAGLEHELRRQLQVTASPDFGARLSAHLRAARPAGSIAAARWMAAAAAAAVVLAIHGLVPRPSERALSAPAVSLAEPALLTPFQGAAAGPALTAKSVDAPGPAPGRPGKPQRARKPAPAIGGNAGPQLEVLVPPTQIRGIARLRELVLSGTGDDQPIPSQPSTAFAPADLVVAPLTVPEIVIPDVQIVTGAAALTGTSAAGGESL